MNSKIISLQKIFFIFISLFVIRLKRRESEFFLNKLESEKKIADVLNLLHKKQDQIENFIREKR